MAIFELEDAVQNVPASTVNDTGLNSYDPIGENYNEKLRLEKLQNESRFGVNDFKAFAKGAAQENFIAEGFSSLKQTMVDELYQEDKLFMENYTSDMKLKDLLDSQLDPDKYFYRLDQSKSEAHRLRIMKEIEEDKENLKFIQENLSPFYQGAASITGALFDIDTLVAGPLSILTKANKTSKLVRNAVGLEVGIAGAKSQMRDDYSFGDAVFDIGIGTFANTMIGKMATMNRFKNDLKAAPKNMDKPSETLMLEWKPQMKYSIDQLDGADNYAKGSNIVDELEFRTHYNSIARNQGEAAAKEFEIGYKDGIRLRDQVAKSDARKTRVADRVKEIAKLEESLTISKGKNKGEPKKLSAKKKQEIENKIQNLKNDNELEGTLTMSEKLDQLKAKELEVKHPDKTLDEAGYEEWNRRIQSRLSKAKNQEEAKAIQAEELKILKQKSEEYKLKLEKKRRLEREDARQAELKRLQKREANIIKMKKNSSPLKYFFRRQDEVVEQVLKEKNTVKAQKLVNEAKEFEDLVLSLGDTVGKSLARLGRRLEAGTIKVDDIKDVISILMKKYPEEYKKFRAIEKYFMKHRSGDIANGGKILEDIVSQFKGLNRLQKAGLTSFLLFAPASLLADDGSEISPEAVLIPAILALAGLYVAIPWAVNTIAKGNLKSSIMDIGEDIVKNSSNAHYMISGEGKGLSKIIDRLHKGLSSGFNSTYKGFMSKIDKRLNADSEQAIFAKDIVSKLFFNPLNGAIQTLDASKVQMIKEVTSKSNELFKRHFKLYAIRMSNNSRLKAAMNTIALEQEYNRKLANMLDGTIPVEKEFEEVVAAHRAVFEKAIDDAVEAGVVGAKEAKAKIKAMGSKPYFPRLWKFTELTKVFNKIKSGDKDKIISAIASGLKGSEPEAKAKLLVEWLEQTNFNSRLKDSDNTLAQIEDFLEMNDVDLLKSDPKLHQLKQMLMKDSEQSSRFKDRLDIDWSKVNLPEIELDGVMKQLEIEDFVDRDVRDVIEQYTNDIYSKVQLKKMGFPSIQTLKNDINVKILDPEINKELNVALDILMNKPVYDEITAVAQLAEIAKGLTFITLMPFVSFSMAVEIGKTIHNAGLSNTLKAFKHQIGNLDKDSLEFALLESTGGLGVSANKARYDFRGLEQYAADDIAEWSITRAVKKAQQVVAKGSGLIDISDITQKANYLAHSSEFAKLVNGRKNKLMKGRLESYGISDETAEMFKDKFQFNEKGDLLNFDKNTWTLDERLKFNNVMLRLNQEMTPEILLGTQGLWQRTPLGKIGGFLLSYPINLFENQAVKDAHFMDSRTFSNTVLTFGGSYLGMVAKYEALGRDYEDKDLIAYSVLNLPSMGLFSSILSLGDSAITSQASQLKQDIEAITIDKLKGE